ncbi:transport and golgi organization 6 [Dermatophagoides pteronyssinus]|uniref:transport and golgi organization 6 n=1 Tax=Dermatophagoides pteronyssinus TaxID=6956 RepID=UPI003F674FDB
MFLHMWIFFLSHFCFGLIMANNIKDFLQILAKWITLVKDNNITDVNAEKWYSCKLSEIDLLNERIEKLISCENFDNHGDHLQQQVQTLFEFFVQLVENLRKNVETILSNNNDSLSTNTSSTNNYEIRKLQAVVIRLSLIMIHTKTVVGLMIGNSLMDHQMNVNHFSPETKISTPAQTLLSTNEESLIRLSLCHSLRLSFKNILKFYLYNSISPVNFEKIFPISLSNDMFDSIEQEKQSVEIFVDDNNFISVKNEGIIKWSLDHENIEKQLTIMKSIYLIYLQLLLIHNENVQRNYCVKLIKQTLRKDCFAILLALSTIYRLQSPKTNLNEELQSIMNQLETQFIENHFNDQTCRSLVIHNLVALLALLSSQHGGPDSETKKLSQIIVNMLRNHLINSGGLRLLIDTTLDSDRQSEHETTIVHRLQAMVTMVITLPVRHKLPYQQKLVSQLLLELLKPDHSGNNQHSPEIYYRFAAMLLDTLNQTEPSLIQKIVFDTIKKSFHSIEHEFTIEETIKIIHRLISNRSCLLKLSNFFPAIFYLRFEFEMAKNQILHIPLKEQSEKLIVEMLREIPKSVYMLDDCICSHQSLWMNHFCIEIDQSSHQIKINENSDKCKEPVDSLSQTNVLATFILRLLDQMTIDFRFNFFYLLLEHLMDKNPSTVVLFLIGPFGDRLFGQTISKREQDDREAFIISSQRTIHFLNSTLERIVQRIIQIPDEQNIDDEDFQQYIQIWMETLSICLRILSILIEKIETNSKIIKPNSITIDESNQSIMTILNDLHPCYNSLGILLHNSQTLKWLSPEDNLLSENLYHRFEKLYAKKDIPDYNQQLENNSDLSNPLQLALKDLQNNDFMPGQAHALIIIKKLVLNRHPSILVMFDQVISEVKKILRDSESYLYLAAIRTLSAFAIIHTDRILPILIDELISTETRPLSDRLKIGETIIQLTYSIGDFAHHYSSLLINGMLLGVKSSEPAIRISCLSCLGEFCRRFRYGLSKYMIELMSMIEQIITTDPELEVRRAAVLFLHLLLKGVDHESAILLQNHLKNIKNIILDVGNRTLDDILQRHCSNAYEQISRIAEELLRQNE